MTWFAAFQVDRPKEAGRLQYRTTNRPWSGTVYSQFCRTSHSLPSGLPLPAALRAVRRPHPALVPIKIFEGIENKASAVKVSLIEAIARSVQWASFELEIGRTPMFTMSRRGVLVSAAVAAAFGLHGKKLAFVGPAHAE